MHLIEREPELATLRTLFTESLDGHGKIAMISGSVASGKTALLRAFAEHAIGSGAVFLDATATRAERKKPLGVIMNLFRRLDSWHFNEEEFQAKASTRMTRHVLDELCKTLFDLTAQTPLVIGIEDVHHADPASLQFLLYLSHRLKSVRMLTVLTECVGPSRQHQSFHADLLSQPHFRHIRLNLLSRRGQAQLLATRFDAATVRRLTSPCHTLTGGNPLLVQAVLEDNRVLGQAGAELTVDAAFAQAVLSCLHRGWPAMLRVARALAILREPVSPALLGRLVKLTSDQAANAVEAMNMAGLLDAGRFRHPAARTVVLDSMSPEESAALHGRAARLLHEYGAAPATVAGNLAAAGTADPWAAPVLAEAADQAMDEGKSHTAVSYLRLALGAAPDERDRARIASALAHAEWWIDPASVNQLLPTLITAARERRLGVRRVTLLLHYLMWSGRATEARDILQQMTAAAHPWEPAQELEATGLLMSCLYPGVVERAKPSPAIDDKWNTSAMAARQLRAATALAAALTGDPEDCDVSGSADQVLQGARLGNTPTWSVIAALTALICSDQPDRAAWWCDLLLEDATTLNKPVEHATLQAIRAVIFVRQGEPAEAERHARAALSRIVPASWGVTIGTPISAIVLAATQLGRFEDAATYLGAIVPEAMFQTPYALPYLQARGYYHLATGQPSVALQDFQTCGALMRAWGFDTPGLIPWRADAARALAELGRMQEAAALVDEQRTMAPPGGREPASARRARSQADEGRRPALAPEPKADPAAGLTEAEWRVAGLAAQGHTNRQIAGLLGITVSTVEQHLTRAYRKLHVNRRSDLRPKLGAVRVSEFTGGAPEDR